jgi:hypothetical protein
MLVNTQRPFPHEWPLIKTILFRFFFIYFVFSIAPWTWAGDIPFTGKIADLYYTVVDGIVNAGNKNFFHIKDQLVPVNGSSDTSYAWAQLCLTVSFAALSCIVWSLLDIKRSYPKMDYWLRTLVRYYTAMVALNYGIEKLFALQMPSPTNSLLLTQVGKLLPMRLLWLTIGYSTKYQIFSGVLEVSAGLLLLYRKTATLGIWLAVCIFMNVVMLNLCYDVPVKILSLNLLACCLFLLSYDVKRIVSFFILNTAVAPNANNQLTLAKPWMRMGRVFIKIIFIYVVIIRPFEDVYSSTVTILPINSFKTGVYYVQGCRVMDTLPALYTDKLDWSDIVFERDGTGSINSRDTLLRQQYGRSYFNYTTDTVLHILALKKMLDDDTAVYCLHYSIKDKDTLLLHGSINNQQVQIIAIRNKTKFPLEEQQLHWLSEGNS